MLFTPILYFCYPSPKMMILLKRKDVFKTIFRIFFALFTSWIFYEEPHNKSSMHFLLPLEASCQSKWPRANFIIMHYPFILLKLLLQLQFILELMSTLDKSTTESHNIYVSWINSFPFQLLCLQLMLLIFFLRGIFLLSCCRNWRKKRKQRKIQMLKI